MHSSDVPSRMFFLLLFITALRHINGECGTRDWYEILNQSGTDQPSEDVAQPGEFPWQVSIQHNGLHICGGSILNSWWILTAAHCFEEPRFFKHLTVVSGTTNLEKAKQVRRAERLIIHSGYNNHNNIVADNDIALIELDYEVNLREESSSICLPYLHDVTMWEDCWVSGWTKNLKEKVTDTDILQKVHIEPLKAEECNDLYEEATDNIFCVSKNEGEKIKCQGDSGGPLVCNNGINKKWYMVGIASFGDDCAQDKNLGTYTKVPNYIDWIMTATEDAGKPFIPESTNQVKARKLSLKKIMEQKKKAEKLYKKSKEKKKLKPSGV